MSDTPATPAGRADGGSIGNPERDAAVLDTETRADFRELLAALRQSGGFSQNALARHAGVSPSTINNLESGERHPTRALTLQLSRSLGLTPPQTDVLLVAARHAPLITDRLSPADPDLRLVATILADESLPVSRRNDFRAIIRGASAFAGYVLPAGDPAAEERAARGASSSAEVSA